MAENDFFDDSTTEPEPTDLENLLARIEALMERLRVTKNIFDYQVLMSLIEEAELWFDDEGGEIPVETPGNALNVQFSPAEVVPVEGEATIWQNVQLQDTDMKMPNFLRSWRNRKLDDGFDISVDRSNACFLFRNLEETGKLWADNPMDMARAFNGKRLRASPRVFLLAGTMMQNMRFMLPTFDFVGADPIADYAFDQAVPFNDEEQRIFRLMFKLVHSKGAYQGSSQLEGRLHSWDVFVNPEQKDSSLHIRVDPLGRHNILTVINHPEWILPTAMAIYNTSRFKRLWYAKARRLAFQIDQGAPRVPGYTKPEFWGFDPESGGGAAYTQWYKLFERHGANDTLPFKPGRQSKLG